MDGSGSSVDISKLPENFDDQNDSLTVGEPSATGQRSMLSQSIISLSFRSQSSTDSYDTIFEPCSTNARRSEPSQIDQPDKNLGTDNSTSNKNQRTHSGRLSSCHVSEVTQETMLLSPRQYPPLQVMDRSAANDLDRTSSSVYTPNNTPQKWSAASTESLFSLHEGRISSILMSNRPSLAVGPETAKTDEKVKEQAEAEADPPKSETTLPDVTVRKISNHVDANVRGPEVSSYPGRNSGKIQPLPTSVNKKHKKQSSCCKSLSCCSCCCKSLSCSSCCSRPKCSCSCPSLSSCCSKPKCSCCKMPSCSCSCCSLKWCCNWNCCSKKSCCSVFKCCSKWSCSCSFPKIKSCCPSCKSCSNAVCCWNWSCWKLLCSWNCNCNCCGKTSCWRNWSCCSIRSCCKSLSCFSKGPCCNCKPWNCCSNATCCFSLNCCCKGSCCSSWNCCSKGSCCKNWKC